MVAKSFDEGSIEFGEVGHVFEEDCHADDVV